MSIYLNKLRGLLRKETYQLLILAVLSLLLSLFLAPNKKPTESPTLAKDTSHLATYIPSGFVLVPLEIQNIENVDSLLGQYGIVDIYTPKNTNALKKDVRLIRSPHDPSQFAVLIPETEAPLLMASLHEPVRIALQNPNAQRASSPQPAFERKIIIQGVQR